MIREFLYNTPGLLNRVITPGTQKDHITFNYNLLENFSQLRGDIYGFCITRLRYRLSAGLLTPFAAPVQDMGINHRSLHVLMAKNRYALKITLRGNSVSH